MGLILYIAGVSLALDFAHRTFGEEMYETYPTVESEDVPYIWLFAIFPALFSWLAVIYFYYRHLKY